MDEKSRNILETILIVNKAIEAEYFYQNPKDKSAINYSKIIEKNSPQN